MEKEPQKASLLGNLKAVNAALRFVIDRYNNACSENGRLPMNFRKTTEFIVRHLFTPGWLKEDILRYSSFEYGRWTSWQVWPKVENPGEFHSSELKVCLDDRPVQVMGWQEQEQLVSEGVDQGLSKDDIEMGFYVETEDNRGINLEWHFHQTPPQNIPNRSRVDILPPQLSTDSR